MTQKKGPQPKKADAAPPQAGRKEGGIRKESRRLDQGSQSGELQPQAAEEQFELERLGVEGVVNEDEQEDRPREVREHDPIIRQRREESAESFHGGTQEKLEKQRRRKAG